MADKNPPNHVSEANGSKVEWRRRRGLLEGDVYTDGELIVTVAFKNAPKLAPGVLDDLAEDAVAFGADQRSSMETEETVLV